MSGAAVDVAVGLLRLDAQRLERHAAQRADPAQTLGEFTQPRHVQRRAGDAHAVRALHVDRGQPDALGQGGDDVAQQAGAIERALIGLRQHVVQSLTLGDARQHPGFAVVDPPAPASAGGAAAAAALKAWVMRHFLDTQLRADNGAGERRQRHQPRAGQQVRRRQQTGIDEVDLLITPAAARRRWRP